MILRSPVRQEVFYVVIVVQTIGLRHQQLDVFVKDLVGAIPEQLFAGGIKQQNAAAGVDQDKTVYRRFDHSRQASHAFTQGALCFLELCEQLFRTPAFYFLLLKCCSGATKLEWRRDGKKLRQQWPKHSGREDGRYRGSRLDQAFDAVDRHPKRIDRQDMRQATSHDEDTERPIDPPEFEVAAL